MATKKEVLEAALRGEGSLGRAADDEPVFVLRAQDLLGSQRVDDWALLAERYGCPIEKVEDAKWTADAMRAWPTRKWPD